MAGERPGTPTGAGAAWRHRPAGGVRGHVGEKLVPGSKLSLPLPARD